MKKIKSTFVLVIVLLGFSIGSRAETPAKSSDDPIAANFFSPEVIMSHQSEIGLKDTQRQMIIDEMKKTQSSMIEVQFKLKAAMQEFASILSASKVDEDKSIGALQKVTKIENEMKTLHVTLMVRIKNALTKDQQEKLRKLSN